MRRLLPLLLVAFLFAPIAVHAQPSAGCMPCPPGPAPTHFGPYGGYGLFEGTCPPADTALPAGKHPYGEITTHWTEYRGQSVVRYLEIAASFSETSTPKPPVVGQGYNNVFPVLDPPWGGPIAVGMGHAGPNQNVGRHQDGPLYIVFKAPTPHSVIGVKYLWLDANHHELWQSPSPLYWAC